MRWTKGRTTKKKEDQAYCLLGMFDVYMPLIYGEGDNAFIRLLEVINKVPQVELNLRTVEGAAFDAYGQTHQGCHPKTRVEVLQSIRDWAQDVRGKSIFWLNGMAGTGKSTISWTVSRWLKDLGAGGPLILGASFFFKRGEGDRASAKFLFPTIASQLATSLKHFDIFLAQSTKANPQICSKSLGEQFDKLIREPLSHTQSDISQSTYLVVIDALDECDNEIDIRTLLQLWQTLSATTSLRLRLFITSRPELVIRLGFKKMPLSLHHDMLLHEVPEPVIQHDIYAFLADALAQIREDYNLEADEDSLTDDWPGPRVLKKLTETAVPLFIVAATIYRFVCDSIRPDEGLQTVLRLGKTGRLSNIGQLYQVVLNSVTANVKDPTLTGKVYCDFRKVVGAIVCLQEPLSRVSLADLLELGTSDIRIQLQPLHALLQVPADGDSLIRPLHLSFPEYLTSPEAQIHPFSIDSQTTNSMLWKLCLRLMSRSNGLRMDICDLRDPGKLRYEVSLNRVSRYIRPAIRYASQYWIDHVENSAICPEDVDELYTFLTMHFLHWLEVLTLIGRLADTIKLSDKLIDKLSSQLVKSRDSSQLIEFLRDMKRFILTNRFMAELAPLQLYYSAVLFVPQESTIRKFCGRGIEWILKRPSTPATWGQELQKIEGHTSDVWSVAFSPDDSLIASSSADSTVRLWNVSTGQEIQKLEGNTKEVHAVTFSPDGSVLATASYDSIVVLWDLFTGRQTFELEGHTSSVCDMSFAHNKSLLASASRDKTIRLWNTADGLEMRKLEGHSSAVLKVVFSVDDSTLVSASHDGSIRLWESGTGQEVCVISGYGRKSAGIALSHDGLLLAFTTDHGTIRLLDLSTMLPLREMKCEGTLNIAQSLAFSYDDSLLATGVDSHVKLWDSSTGQNLCELGISTGDVGEIAFAHNSLLLAAGTLCSTIYLWDLSICQMPQEPSAFRDATVVFSHRGTMLASWPSGESIQVMEVPTGRKLWTLRNDRRMDWNMVFSHDDLLLASASFDGAIHLWHMKTGKKMWRMKRHTGSINALAFSHNDLILASASRDKTVRLWDVSTGHLIQSPLEHANNITKVAFSHDDLTLVSVSYSLLEEPCSDIVRLWDLSTGLEKQVVRTEKHANYFGALASSQDGALLAVAFTSMQHYNKVQLWDSHTCAVIWSHDHRSEIHRISFTADGKGLLTDKGYMDFDVGCSSSEQGFASVTYPGLLLQRDWVTYRGRRILWLPQEYRDVTDVREGMIAFQHATGLVAIMQFDLTVLDSMVAQLQNTAPVEIQE